MTPELMRQVAEISSSHVLQTLILHGKYEAASRIMSAKDGDAVRIEPGEWDALCSVEPKRISVHYPQGIIREAPTHLTKRLD